MVEGRTNVNACGSSWRLVIAASGGGGLLLSAVVWLMAASSTGEAALPGLRCRQRCDCDHGHYISGDGSELQEEGTWYWLRSPEQEKRVIISRYNRYCIRCHGVDGRGVWDMPDVPDFTNARWQTSRSDAQLARIIVEGRGAVMPPFRGTLTLEEAWGMARYLRTFMPGSEAARPDESKPDSGKPENPGKPSPEPMPQSKRLSALPEEPPELNAANQ